VEEKGEEEEEKEQEAESHRVWHISNARLL